MRNIISLLVCVSFLAGNAGATLSAEYNTAVKQTPLISWSGKSANPSLAKSDAAAVSKQVDTLLVEDLAAADSSNKAMQFGQRAPDEVYLRRIYLDLVGRNPTPDEVTAFVLDSSKDKRSNVIQRLLDDPRFGENWGRYWRDVIMYHRSDDRAQLAAPALQEYLSKQFNSNAPWDETVRAFITATGDVRENGATGLIMAQNGNTADITSEISRIFLGVQIQCANCHDHKTDRWKRNQFHELAAFFPRIAVRPLQTDDKRSFEVLGVDRPRPRAPKQVNRPIGSPEHFMPDLNHPESEGTKMRPVFFLTGQKLDFGKPDAERRDTIAKWITAPSDEWFAKAFVNRVWAELVGEGFYEPIDDIGPDRICSAPKTIDCLAHEFVDSHFDVKRLYQIITLTDAYQRESRSRRTPDEMPYAANCPARLRGDQLYDALLAALGVPDNAGPPAGAGGKGALLRSPRNQFSQIFGFDPSTPKDEVTGSIPQALMLMNGLQINRAINGGARFTELGKLLASTSDDEAVTTELYLRCLGREPKKPELQACLTHVKANKNRAVGFEDVLWALINSTGFLPEKLGTSEIRCSMSLEFHRCLGVKVNREGAFGRRDFLKGISASAIAGGLAGGLLHWTDLVTAQAADLRSRGMACILLWMQGGPSQFETFSPKPGTATGGETKAISTAVPGIQIAEGYPELAKQANDIAFIRSVNSREGAHPRAQLLMHTGYLPMATVKYPTLGSLVAHEIGGESGQLPSFVRIGGVRGSGGSGGFLGTQYDPFDLTNPNAPPTNTTIPTDLARYHQRLDLLGKLETAAGNGKLLPESVEHQKLYERAAKMITSPDMKAFDLTKENDKMRAMYGDTNFGAGCLLARRLIESGVTFVEVVLDGWDTHQDNFARTSRLADTVDKPFAALVADLRQRGMLDKTLVIWMGEFGRTPNINANTGRDHFPKAFNVALAGGGVRGGQVIGETDAAGQEIKDRPVAVNDLFQTFCKSLGMKADHENMSPIGRPIKVVDGGKSVHELFA